MMLKSWKVGAVYAVAFGGLYLLLHWVTKDLNLVVTTNALITALAVQIFCILFYILNALKTQKMRDVGFAVLGISLWLGIFTTFLDAKSGNANLSGILLALQLQWSMALMIFGVHLAIHLAETKTTPMHIHNR